MNIDETKDQTQDGRVKKNDDSYTRIMQLVRGLSNQDEDIDGKPKISYALKTLHRFAEERRDTHDSSKRYFDRLNSLFFWPSVTLTSLTSAFSFFATQFPESSTKFNVGIGIMASISTLIVALSETYRYGSKAEQHGLASESYENLRTKLFFKTVELRMNDGEAMTPCEFKSFFKSIEDQITEIARQCKDLVPNKIAKDYKDVRYNNMIDALSRNLRTVIAQEKFSRIISKLAKGEHLHEDDVNELELIEKMTGKKDIPIETV